MLPAPMSKSPALPPVLTQAGSGGPDEGDLILRRLSAVLDGPAEVLARDPLHIALLVQSGEGQNASTDLARNLKQCNNLVSALCQDGHFRAFCMPLTEDVLQNFGVSLANYEARTKSKAIDLSTIRDRLRGMLKTTSGAQSATADGPCPYYGNRAVHVFGEMAKVVANACAFNPKAHEVRMCFCVCVGVSERDSMRVCVCVCVRMCVFVSICACMCRD